MAAADTAEAEALIEEHYSSNWEIATSVFREQVLRCSVDDEAKLAFEEALAAHDQWLFRVAPRLLFPELERIARIELEEPPFAPIASQHALGELAGQRVGRLSLVRALTPNRYIERRTARLQAAGSLLLGLAHAGARQGVGSTSAGTSGQ